MTLRRKTVVIITATLAGLILILFAVSESIFLRDLGHSGQTTVLYFLCLLLGAGVVFIGVFYLLLDRLVLSPLSRLSSTVNNIGRTRALSARVIVKGKDELSGLSSGINRMLESLEHSHEELRESEEKFKHLVEDMNDGYFAVQNSRIVFANTRSAEMFGRSAEEVTGRTVDEFLPHEEVKVLSEWYERRLRGEAVPHQYETTLTRNDGTTVTVEFGARRMYYAGRPAVSVVMRDITRRRQMEEALRESEAKYREVVERANDVVAIVQDTIIKYINKRSSEMLGYLSEEMIGTPFTEYIHPDELQRVISHYERWIAGDTVNSMYETALLHKSGDRVDIELNAGSITYEGRPANLIIVRDITERKKVLQALQQSEEHYSTLVGSLTDAVFKSKGKLITWCNDRVEEIYGYKRDELIGKETAFLFPEGVSHSKFAAEVAEAIRKQGCFHGTHRVKRKNGSLVDVEYTISQVKGVEGSEPTELVSVARDITERKRIEEELSDSEEKFRNVLDNSLDMIYSMNLQNGKYEYVSPASKQVLGYSPKEFQALNQEELISLAHPDDAEKLQQNIIDLIMQKDAQALSFEYRVKHKELGYRWVSDSRSVVYDDANMPVAIVGSLRDVTGRKLADEALRQREQDYLILLESTHDSIVVVDAETLKVVFGNRRSSLMFGFDPVLHDGVGMNLLDFVYPEDREIAIKGFMEDLYQRERRQRYDVRAKTKDGREIWVSALATRIEFQGRVAVLLSLKDVTETRRAEEKLKQTMEELVRSNTELERFAYVASHDLQEPLRMVTSYTQLLARRYKGKLDPDADEFIGYAVDGATRMQQLINALLDYSRIGTRGKPFEPTSCEEILNQAIANLQAAIEENGAVVTHGHLPTVMADATQMVQLFQNLISNAIKFHSEMKPEVHVGAERNGTEWIFSVRDNGIGIDPQYFDRIFVIFNRLHNRQEYPGTGIGLTICKKIIERHNGRIWVESQPGNGATFYFTIPNGREEK
jgi:PAS domain S-box-containing protein